LLIDFYIWQALKVITKNNNLQSQEIVKIIFWGISLISVAGLWAYNFISADSLGIKLRTVIVSMLFIVYVSKLIAVLFIVIDDISRLFMWLKEKLEQKKISGL